MICSHVFSTPEFHIFINKMNNHLSPETFQFNKGPQNMVLEIQVLSFLTFMVSNNFLQWINYVYIIVCHCQFTKRKIEVQPLQHICVSSIVKEIPFLN